MIKLVNPCNLIKIELSRFFFFKWFLESGGNKVRLSHIHSFDNNLFDVLISCGERRIHMSKINVVLAFKETLYFIHIYMQAYSIKSMKFFCCLSKSNKLNWFNFHNNHDEHIIIHEICYLIKMLMLFLYNIIYVDLSILENKNSFICLTIIMINQTINQSINFIKKEIQW